MFLFANLCNQLTAAASTKEKQSALEGYLSATEEENITWTLSILMGNRPKRVVSTSLLREWAIVVSDYSPWLFQQCYEIGGDLAETIATLLPNQDFSSEVSFADILTTLRKLSKSKPEVVKTYVLKLWGELDKQSCFVFNKLLTGSFRISVSNQTLSTALSSFLDIPETTVSHRLLSGWTPENSSLEDIFNHQDDIETLAKPYLFSLANRIISPEEKITNPDQWIAEWKWAGERTQLIKRKGEVFLWTKSGDLVTQKFPEIQKVKDSDFDNFVLDGQIITHDGSQPLPLGSIEKRIKKKAATKKTQTDLPILFVLFDILEQNGTDMRSNSYSKRRSILKKVFEEKELPSQFVLSEQLAFDNWETVVNLREVARERGASGLMLKHLSSPYHAEKEGLQWYKWDVNPLSIKAVLLYATGVQGRRSKVFSGFSFAVKKGDQLIPFVKTLEGLGEKDLEEISAFVVNNTIETFGPVRSVKPELVFEIEFMDIAASARHKSGIYVFKPRINFWLKEKTLGEVNTIQELHRLLDLYVPKHS